MFYQPGAKSPAHTFLGVPYFRYISLPGQTATERFSPTTTVCLISKMPTSPTYHHHNTKQATWGLSTAALRVRRPEEKTRKEVKRRISHGNWNNVRPFSRGPSTTLVPTSGARCFWGSCLILRLSLTFAFARDRWFAEPCWSETFQSD